MNKNRKRSLLLANAVLYALIVSYCKNFYSFFKNSTFIKNSNFSVKRHQKDGSGLCKLATKDSQLRTFDGSELEVKQPCSFILTQQCLFDRLVFDGIFVIIKLLILVNYLCLSLNCTITSKDYSKN